MEFLERYRKHIIISSILLIFLLLSIFIYYKSNNSKSKIKEKVVDAVILDNDDEIKEESTEEIIVEEYYVDVKGAVNYPGVYALSSNSRVNDAVNQAGGVTIDADTRCINLSKKIKDEMVIYIYTKQEVEEIYKEDENNDNIIFNNIINDAYIDYTNPGESEIIDTNISEDTRDKININTADISLLTTLPNIGESKAKAIISKREEKGKFNSIDELKEVSGIGESTFEKLKDLITVE